MAFKVFGFTFGNQEEKIEQQTVRSFAPPENNDGAINVAALDAFGTPVAYSLDLDGSASSENILIDKYREIAMIPEVDKAIEEIISDAIVGDQTRKPVTVNLDSLDSVSPAIKKKIEDGFDHILKLLHFKTKGYDVFRRFYIDGRLNYHIMIDEKNIKQGIVEVRYIDPKKIKKIREVVRDKSSVASPADPNSITAKRYREYYIYNERGIESSTPTSTNQVQSGMRIAKESIAHVNSGMHEPRTNMVVSHLHKALRAANNLRMMEDSLVIYRLARAPERRIFYVDVGNLPKGRAEQYMHQIMSKYKNKLVYDATTGDVKDDRRHLAMTEDYWIPRREGSTGTEITTLPGGENLGVIEDIQYFKQKLIESLNIPIGRFNQEPSMFSRGTEITRDELRFARFISRLRTRFSMLFDDLLGKHLVLTGVMSWDFWENIKDEVIYDFAQDNYFAEAMESEILTQRMNLVTEIDAFVGKYFSKEYVMSKVLKMTEEEIKTELEQMKSEVADGQIIDPVAMQTGEMEQNANESQFDLHKDVTEYISESEAELNKSMAEFFKSMTADAVNTTVDKSDSEQI